MSIVKVQGNASGTGIFTVASPNSNTDRTLTLPDATGTVQVSGNPISGTTGTFSGDLTLGSSTLATPTGSAPSYLCRAWVNFNGTGTVAIRGSGNVSSITDNGTGDYTVNFTTAMPDANYCPVLSGIGYNGPTDPTRFYVVHGNGGSATQKTVSALRISVGYSGTGTDTVEVNASIFR